MTSVGNIELRAAAAALQPRGATAGADAVPVPTKGSPDTQAKASSAEANPGSAPAKESAGLAVDERALDRIAQRLIKRDPELAIEKDEAGGGYIYRFFDKETGELVRQFPAEKALETMRALHQVADHKSDEKTGPGLAV